MALGESDKVELTVTAEPQAGKTLADTSTAYHFLHTDHLGTPVLATDETCFSVPTNAKP